MTNAEKLKEVLALIEALKSEISITSVYVENEERWASEMEREEKKLQLQKERVERLRYRRDCGPELIQYHEERILELKAEAAALRNRVKVERMQELFREANSLTGGLSEEVLDNLRKNFGMGEARSAE